MKCPACGLSYSTREVRGVVVRVCLSCLDVGFGKEGAMLLAGGPLDPVAVMVAEAEREIHVDPLSGLRNRRFFDREIRSLIERASSATPLSLVLFDLDGFKEANDRHGHLAGDRVIAEFARILRDEARQIDRVARLGGDEFGILLPATDEEGAKVLAERVVARAAGHDFKTHEGKSIAGIGVSAGFAAESPNFTTASATASSEDPATLGRSLYARADRALYEAKRSGKGRAFGRREGDADA